MATDETISVQKYGALQLKKNLPQVEQSISTMLFVDTRTQQRITVEGASLSPVQLWALFNRNSLDQGSIWTRTKRVVSENTPLLLPATSGWPYKLKQLRDYFLRCLHPAADLSTSISPWTISVQRNLLYVHPLDILSNQTIEYGISKSSNRLESDVIASNNAKSNLPSKITQAQSPSPVCSMSLLYLLFPFERQTRHTLATKFELSYLCI